MKLLADYTFHKKEFVEAEHRDKIVESYTAKVIFEKE